MGQAIQMQGSMRGGSLSTGVRHQRIHPTAITEGKKRDRVPLLLSFKEATTPASMRTP